MKTPGQDIAQRFDPMCNEYLSASDFTWLAEQIDIAINAASETHAIGEFHIGQYTLTHCTMGGVFIRRPDGEGGQFATEALEKAITEFYERNF